MITKLKQILEELYTWLKSFISHKEEVQPIYSKDYMFGNISLVGYEYPGIIDWSSYLVSIGHTPKSYAKPATGVWVLTPNRGNYIYISVLLNISTYKSTKIYKTSAPKEWTEVFERKLDQTIGSKRMFATHLFIDLWVSKNKITYKMVKGKAQPTYKVFNKNALMLDLQGFKEYSPAGNQFAKSIFIEYLYRLVKLNYINTTMTWDQIVQSIDSAQWIETIAEKYLGDDHKAVKNRSG